jgi:hypothetical protein
VGSDCRDGRVVAADRCVGSGGGGRGAASGAPEGGLQRPLLTGTDCANVSVTAADSVRLEGWYFRPRDHFNGGAVLLLHGVGDWRGSMTGAASMLARNGYSVLAPNLRGHGESGGICTYGVRERLDVRAWTSWLVKHEQAPRIYGLGESLGAAVLIEALPVEPRLRAIVAESAYSSFSEIAEERTNRVAPGWVHRATAPFIAVGLARAKYGYGVDLRNASPLEALERSRTPVLLIHGIEDRETSPENSVRLARANPRDTRQWLVPGAGHALAWQAAGPEFERRVTAWFQYH